MSRRPVFLTLVAAAIGLAASFGVTPARPGPEAAAGAVPVVSASAQEPAPLPAPLTVALDPGHGGLDPGAEAGGQTEAALMLTFARELSVALQAAGFRVVLTRESDEFVSLDARVTRARAAGADVLLSLHADAIAAGRASGARVYSLADSAADEATAALVARHERSDLLTGIDLGGQDDTIAGLLMDLARTETAPRSAALADAIVAALADRDLGLHKEPRLSAGFSVLRAADIPSVLIELGFISSRADRARLGLPAWRAEAAGAIAAALTAWAEDDRARAAGRRR